MDPEFMFTLGLKWNKFFMLKCLKKKKEKKKEIISHEKKRKYLLIDLYT